MTGTPGLAPQGDVWFLKGLLGRDPFLISAEALERMAEAPEHLLGVVAPPLLRGPFWGVCLFLRCVVG